MSLMSIRYHSDRHERGVHYRNVERARCAAVRCRWEIRAWIMARDVHGNPVRVSGTFRTPCAMQFQDVKEAVRGMLEELSKDDMQQPDVRGSTALRAGWVAVLRVGSENAAKTKGPRRR